MTSIVIIPARYQATRFPGKLLFPLCGLPVIQHVYERAKRAQLPADVIVATDSETIFEKVLSFGGKATITATSHQSGTDRIAEVARSIEYDIIVNVQGDEPLIHPDMIDDVIALLDDEEAAIGTIIKRIDNIHELSDPNIVKVVCDTKGYALYFSRALIPYRASHSDIRSPVYYKHIGIYSYRRDALLSLAGMEQTELEKIEKLEQLRALENGMKIKTQETSFETFGIDTPQDIERAEQWLNTSL